jgi:uncharacterized repeat protein (TIGR01451 family)
MRSRAAFSAASLATAAACMGVVGATPAAAHQSPAGCGSNGLVLTPTKDRTLVRNGDTSTYTVSAANNAGPACDVTGATVTLTLPAANGTPTGRTETLATGASFPAGAPDTLLGRVPYLVALNAGVVDAVAEARASGTLHDAPTDHAVQITKTLGTDVTQPSARLTETANPAEGPAPLGVTYTYTVTNDSATNAPIAGLTVSDDKCASVTYVSGDANGNGLLDVGETWTFTCTTTHTTPGEVVSTATATGTNTVDNRPVTIPPAQVRVMVQAPPRRSEVIRRQLPPSNSSQARQDAPCVATPRRLSVRAREMTRVRVTVRNGDVPAAGVLVRIVGPGFVRRTVTNSNGVAIVRVRPTRTGTLVIQTDACAGADRIAVRAARRTSARRVPRVTG